MQLVYVVMCDSNPQHAMTQVTDQHEALVMTLCVHTVTL